MSDTVLIAAIGAATAIVTAVIALVGAYLSRQNKETRLAIDGRLTELLETARALSRAEGVAEGTATERDRP